MALSIEKVLAHATLIGTVEGVMFYEHPVYGDEAGMLAIYRNKMVATDWFDLPEPDDMMGGPEDFMRIYR